MKNFIKPKPTRNQGKSITVVLPNVELRKLCDHAEAQGLPEGPNAMFWKLVDSNGVHVVSFNYEGTGVAIDGNGRQWIRAVVLCKMRGRVQPQPLLCDFDYSDFETMLRNRGMMATFTDGKLALAG